MSSLNLHASATETLSITVPNRAAAIPFRFYTASKQHVVGILQGSTYPIVPQIGSVNTIVDVGANVGSASVMLALKYPNAEVHALEPAPAALTLLDENTAPLPQIHVHRHGLHDHTGSLRLYRSQWDPMSGSVLESAENTTNYDEVAFTSAAEWLHQQQIDAIDILKIDTEGCEIPILRALAEQATNARVVYLEYHSEADRRSIDTLLCDSHILASSTANHPHRGDVCYVHRETAYAAHHARLIIAP